MAFDWRQDVELLPRSIGVAENEYTPAAPPSLGWNSSIAKSANHAGPHANGSAHGAGIAHPEGKAVGILQKASDHRAHARRAGDGRQSREIGHKKRWSEQDTGRSAIIVVG